MIGSWKEVVLNKNNSLATEYQTNKKISDMFTIELQKLQTCKFIDGDFLHLGEGNYYFKHWFKKVGNLGKCINLSHQKNNISFTCSSVTKRISCSVFPGKAPIYSLHVPMGKHQNHSGSGNKRLTSFFIHTWPKQKHSH